MNSSERSRKRRSKMKGDPERWAAYLEKERQRSFERIIQDHNLSQEGSQIEASQGE